MEEIFATKEEMKTQAIKRLKELNYISDALRAFEKEDRVMVSERTSIGDGILFDFDGEDYKKAYEKAKQVEEKYGGLVYAVVRSCYKELGTIYAFLWQSKYKDEWDLDATIENAKTNNACGYVMTYCFNETYDFGEFGDIYVKASNGGLRRVDY